jgi:hypothetical protein
MTVPSCQSTQSPTTPGRAISNAMEVTWDAHPQATAQDDRVSSGRSTNGVSGGDGVSREKSSHLAHCRQVG